MRGEESEPLFIQIKAYLLCSLEEARAVATKPVTGSLLDFTISRCFDAGFWSKKTRRHHSPDSLMIYLLRR